MPDYIALVRGKPSPDAARGFAEDLRNACRGYDVSKVFLHGDGVEAMAELASDAPSGVDWLVCRTSLARRSLPGHSLVDTLIPPFRLATLVAFYQSVLSADRVDSAGLGGRVCFKMPPTRRASQSGPRVLLEVGFAPLDERQHQETLEMALGAAALELDACVLFTGAGRAHLDADGARGWRQLTDFGLLEICVEDPLGRFASEIVTRAMDSGQAAQLRADAATILIL